MNYDIPHEDEHWEWVREELEKPHSARRDDFWDEGDQYTWLPPTDNEGEEDEEHW